MLEARLVGADSADIEFLTRPFPLRLDVRPDGTEYDILSAAVDGALHDIEGKRAGVPAHRLYGGTQRTEVWTSWVAFIRDLRDLETEIAGALELGFTAFKLKVGGDRRLDRERLRLVRELAGDGAHIKLDANAAWTTDEAVEIVRSLAPWRPDGIETPVAYHDMAAKREVRERTGVRVLEHAHDVAFARRLIDERAADVFNVSTTGAGGIPRAREVLAVAEAAGVECLLGSTVELGLGTAAQLQLAASSPMVRWPSDLVGPLLYVDDVLADGLSWRNGYWEVPTGPGLGVTVDPSRPEALRCDL